MDCRVSSVECDAGDYSGRGHRDNVRSCGRGREEENARVKDEERGGTRPDNEHELHRERP